MGDIEAMNKEPVHQTAVSGDATTQQSSNAVTDPSGNGQCPTSVENRELPNDGLRAMEERIIAAIKGLDSKLDQKVAELKDDFTAGLAGVKQTLEANSKKIQDIESSLNYAHKEIKDLTEAQAEAKKKNKTLEERETSTGKRLSELKHDLETTKQELLEKLNNQESREYSVRIRNMEIKSDTSYVDQVASIIVEKKLVPEGTTTQQVAQRIEIAHPLKGTPNSMMARFYARPYRNHIVQQAKTKLNKETGEKGVRLVEDLTKLDFQRKMKAVPQMKQAFDEGKKARFYRGHLIINGEQVPIKTDNDSTAISLSVDLHSTSGNVRWHPLYVRERLRGGG